MTQKYSHLHQQSLESLSTLQSLNLLVSKVNHQKSVLLSNSKTKNLSQNLKTGVIHIRVTKNNSILTLSLGSRVIAWSSAGSVGFKNSRKSTQFACQSAVRVLLESASKHNYKQLVVKVIGHVTRTKSTLVRALNRSPIRIAVVTDNTPVAHNGCRRSKTRRC